MVVVILNNLQFEADKFETRTMPTPDMKSKEMIYWIKIGTTDRRLASDLQRFLEGAPKYIELRVPSAFITARTELESYRVFPPKGTLIDKETSTEQKSEAKNVSRNASGSATSSRNTTLASESRDGNDGRTRVEILLRRTLPQTPDKSAQSPYG